MDSREPSPAPGAPSGAGDTDEVAPPVVIVVVAHDPGEWFEESLRSIAGQSYANSTLLVVDAASSPPVDPAWVAAVVPGAPVLRVDEDHGFGAAVNAGVAAVEGAAFFLVCHDDVRLAPDVVQVMVEESFRSNAGVVGPKLVSWERPDRLLAVGMGADKLAAPAPLVERGELDQRQHDTVDDVFYVPSATMLIRTDLFTTLEGFDPGIDVVGDDLELCWRAHVAGARVIVAPGAVAAHREALEERPDAPRRRPRRIAHQLRTTNVCYGRWHRLRVRPQLYLLTLLELLWSVVTARFADAGSVLRGVRDGRTPRAELRARRELVARIRQVSDGEIRRLQVRGYARIRAFLLQRRAPDRDELAEATGTASITSGRPAGAVAVWLAVAAYLVVGARSLLGSPVPAVGQLVGFPAEARVLFEAWTSAMREVGVGTTGPAPTFSAFAGFASMASLGSTTVARQVLILATLPLGAIGMWRLCRPIGSRRARLAGLIGYVAAPVAVNALSAGRWGALWVYALAPWIFALLARAGRMVPFGSVGGVAGPGVVARPFVHHVLALGVLGAVVGALAPVVGVVIVGIAVALVLGGLLAGRGGGWHRVLGAGALSVGVAGVLLGPWVAGFGRSPFEQLAGSGSSVVDGRRIGLAEILRFDTGPEAVGLAGYGLVVAALLPLLIARDWRLSWAVRAWTVVLAAWSVVWVAAQGWIDPHPPPEVFLAVAAVGLSFAVALGMAAFEVDLPDYHFGWRQVTAVVAGAGFIVFLLPAVGALSSGSWGLPNTSFAPSVDRLAERTDGPFRVLWLGDPAVLPLESWALDTEAGPRMAFGVSYGGPPGVEDLFPVPGNGTDRLSQDLEAALAGDTNRLGEMLGPMGIRYVLVPDRRAPAPEVAEPEAPRPGAIEMLDSQLDLARVEGNPALAVYQNAAWSPVRSLLAEGDPVDEVPAGAPTALRVREGYARFSGALEPATVYVATDDDHRWVLEQDGQAWPAREVQGWSTAFDVAASGPATLEFRTGLADRLVLVAQGVAWLVVLVVLARARNRDARRRARGGGER